MGDVEKIGFCHPDSGELSHSLGRKQTLRFLENRHLSDRFQKKQTLGVSAGTYLEITLSFANSVLPREDC